MTGNIFDIQRFCTDDGPGIRTTVFFKGCNLKCSWCHNPESQQSTRQMLLYKDKCTGCGRCKDICPNNMQECELCGKCELYCLNDARRICGKEYSVDEIMTEILKDKAFYESSSGGVTFSGGECMLQIDFLEALLRECKKNGLHTAIDTAGHIPYSYFERIIPYANLFLYDVKCYDSETHKQHTSVGNELILQNLKALLGAKKSVWIRIPIIPGVNDTAEEMTKIQQFLVSNGTPEKIELLPYHAMGENKYSAMGKESHPFTVPTEKKMNELRSVFL